VLAEISKRAAGFKSLKDSWADTTSARGQLMLTILGGLAEFERELIRARTGEGRKRAKARGVRFGRPRKMTSHQRQEALRRLHAGETMPEVARTYAVDGSPISRLAASSPFGQSAADVRSAGAQGIKDEMAKRPSVTRSGAQLRRFRFAKLRRFVSSFYVFFVCAAR